MKKLNVDDFFKFITDDELLEYENTYKFHLNSKSIHNFFTKSEINNIHKLANTNLKKNNN